jgi:phosphohistidine phosphatase
MTLYLLRHADAEMPAPTDDARPLSPKGIEQAQQAGRFCARHEVRPSVILTSPLTRAAQTAQPVAEATGSPLIVVPWLASGMAPHDAVEELKAYRTHDSAMIVGHEPDFSHLIALLLGLPGANQLHVRKGSLTALNLDIIRAGAARLEWSLPARYM